MRRVEGTRIELPPTEESREKLLQWFELQSPLPTAEEEVVSEVMRYLKRLFPCILEKETEISDLSRFCFVDALDA